MNKLNSSDKVKLYSAIIVGIFGILTVFIQNYDKIFPKIDSPKIDTITSDRNTHLIPKKIKKSHPSQNKIHVKVDSDSSKFQIKRHYKITLVVNSDVKDNDIYINNKLASFESSSNNIFKVLDLIEGVEYEIRVKNYETKFIRVSKNETIHFGQ